MRRLLFIPLICLFVSGCVHSEFLCGNAIFVFFEGEVRTVEANLRDDRLLHTDVFIRGTMAEWRPSPKWKAQGFFTISVELEATAPIENVGVFVVSGRQGSGSYASIPVFQSESFVGRKQLVSFDVGGDIPDAQIELSFGKKEAPLHRKIEIKDLWNGVPNQSRQPTITSVTDHAAARFAPATVVADS
mgnify:CR=1 FL=1